MKKIAALLAVLALIVASCSTSPKSEDLTTVERGDSGSSLQAEVTDPDSVTIYRNVDEYPNINVMCVNGDAIITRSTTYTDYFVVHIPGGTHNLCD